MKTLFKIAAPLAVAVGIAFAPKPAHALGPIGIEVGAVAGGATSATSLAPLGFGIGGRAGITIFNIYGGLNIIDYIGGGNGLPGSSVHALEAGGQLGYGIKLLDIFTLRPQVGLGNITFSAQYGSLPSSSQGSLYVEPGVTALITLGILYIGADLNALIITSGPPSSLGTSTSTDSCFTTHGQVGLSF